MLKSLKAPDVAAIFNDPSAQVIQIHFYRHGETTWNVENRIKGQINDTSIVMTPAGIERCKHIADIHAGKKIDLIVSSDSPRAQETIGYIQEKVDAPVLLSEAIRPLNMGQRQGLLRSEFMQLADVQACLEDYSLKFPGGESINDLRDRLYGFLENLVQENPGAREIIVVTHGAVISLLKENQNNQSYSDVSECRVLYKNGEFHVVESAQPPGIPAPIGHTAERNKNYG